MKHTICPNCGANLDFGEKCDCQKIEFEDFEEKKRKIKTKHNLLLLTSHIT